MRKFESRSHLTRIGVGLAAAASACALVIACGTDAVGVEACRQIETARCLQAENCGIDLSMPVHRGAPGTDIDACIRFYHDQCLHGLATTVEPGSQQVTACVNAITYGSCQVVKQPESDPACVWLIPPITTTTDASDEGDTADAAVDDTATGYLCPAGAGCVDLGTALPVCNGLHDCTCTSAVVASTSTCQLIGANEDQTIVYCCN